MRDRKGQRPGNQRPNGARGGRPAPPTQRRPMKRFTDSRTRALELLEIAVQYMQDGQHVKALEAAGESVYLDPSEARGYILIGDIHLHEGDISEAKEAYVKGLAKAKQGKRDPDIDEQGTFLALEAQSGISRCALMLADYDGALDSLLAQLRLDTADPLGAGQLLAELYLFKGDYEKARKVFLDQPPLLPDGFLVAGFAHYECGDLASAVSSLRLALLSNLYLVAALLGEEPPDFGIIHGIEEAGPIFATDVAIRIEPYLSVREEVVEFVADLATCPTVMKEVQAVMDYARALNTTADATERGRMIHELARLRDPSRIDATTPSVLTGLGGLAPPSSAPPASEIPC